jgi:hypothetical protein
MAIDFITVNTAKPLGARAVQAANQLRAYRELIALLVGDVNHMNNGSDYTTVESQFGLQSGTGANFTTLLNIQNDIINGTAGAGGSTQQGQILEFCNRLAGQ